MNESPKAASRRLFLAGSGALGALGAMGTHLAEGASAHARPAWRRAWAAAMQAPDAIAEAPDTALTFRNATLRQVLRPTLDGPRLRIWLSHQSGTRSVEVGHASIARSEHADRIDAKSRVTVTFGGSHSVVLNPGLVCVSDPVALPVKAFEPIAISLHLPGSTLDSVNTVHQDGRETGYVLAEGDHIDDVALPGAKTFQARFYISGLDVETAGVTGTIACVGDSITDGYGLPMDTTARWPDTLARRLHVSGAARSVVNLGISGNRLLQRWNGPCLLARLDHDVLSIPAIRWIVFLIGINDLGAPGYLMRPEESVSAAEIQWGLEQIAVRAHDHGIRVMAGTLTPSGGTGMGYSGDEVETKRRVVNEWIRRASVFDAVIDFDAAVRDPADPTRIRSEFDSGDHLHPNAAGLAAMANTIDLRLL